MTNAVDKKTETPKQQPKTANPSELAKTKKESDVELTEEELTRATGGAVDAFIWFESPKDIVQPKGETKN